jgi:CPA2 family monovalent cation:H+ antiporter-2
MILGIILFEDIFLAVYLTVVSGVVLSDAASLGAIAVSLVGAFVFIAICLLAGLILAKTIHRQRIEQAILPSRAVRCCHERRGAASI